MGQLPRTGWHALLVLAIAIFARHRAEAAPLAVQGLLTHASVSGPDGSPPAEHVWTVSDARTGVLYVLPGQPSSAMEGRPIAPGSRVVLTCEAAPSAYPAPELGGDFTLAPVVTCASVSRAVVVAAAAPLKSTGLSINWLVLIVTLTGPAGSNCTAAPLVTAAQATSLINGTNGYHAHFASCSNGAFTINRPKFRVQSVNVGCSKVLPAGKCNGAADVVAVGAEAIAQAKLAMGAAFAQYDRNNASWPNLTNRISIILPNSTQFCGWPLGAESPGVLSYLPSYPNQGINRRRDVFKAMLLNFGVGGVSNVNPLYMPLEPSWGNFYEDHYSPLGLGDVCPSSIEQYYLGWSQPIATLTSTSPPLYTFRRFTLTPLAAAGGTPASTRYLRIRSDRNDMVVFGFGSLLNLYLELRSNVGGDRNLWGTTAFGVTDMVNIRIVDRGVDDSNSTIAPTGYGIMHAASLHHNLGVTGMIIKLGAYRLVIALQGIRPRTDAVLDVCWALAVPGKDTFADYAPMCKFPDPPPAPATCAKPSATWCSGDSETMITANCDGDKTADLICINRLGGIRSVVRSSLGCKGDANSTMEPFAPSAWCAPQFAAWDPVHPTRPTYGAVRLTTIASAATYVTTNPNNNTGVPVALAGATGVLKAFDGNYGTGWVVPRPNGSSLIPNVRLDFGACFRVHAVWAKTNATYSALGQMGLNDATNKALNRLRGLPKRSVRDDGVWWIDSTQTDNMKLPIESTALVIHWTMNYTVAFYELEIWGTNCESTDECHRHQGICGRGTCVKNRGRGYKCVCDPGATLQATGSFLGGPTCVVTNPCTSWTVPGETPCGTNGTCTAKADGTYACTCADGLPPVDTPQGLTCSRTCGHATSPQCHRFPNTAGGCMLSLFGGAYCECKLGYTYRNGRCVQACGDKAKGMPPAYDCGVGGTCRETPTGITCVCQPGYYYANGQCRDACWALPPHNNVCGQGGTNCTVNPWGRASCSCDKASLYTSANPPNSLGYSARDENDACVGMCAGQCLADGHPLTPPFGSTCSATAAGGAVCNCNVTATYYSSSTDPKLCIPRCSTAPCGAGSTCAPLANGRYRCNCKAGTAFVNGTCIDVCKSGSWTPGGGNNPCHPGTCAPGAGNGYICTCPEGTRWMNGTCVDYWVKGGINTCAPGTPINTANGVLCSCPTYYTQRYTTSVFQNPFAYNATVRRTMKCERNCLRCNPNTCNPTPTGAQNCCNAPFTAPRPYLDKATGSMCFKTCADNPCVLNASALTAAAIGQVQCTENPMNNGDQYEISTSSYTCKCPPGTSGACGPECFPADARVQLPGGRTARMDQLHVGDRVLTIGPDGKRRYERIYLFGHKLPAAEATFVQLAAANNRTLRLSPGHYVHVVTRGSACMARHHAAAQVAPAASQCAAGWSGVTHGSVCAAEGSSAPLARDAALLACAVTLPARLVREGDVIFTAGRHAAPGDDDATAAAGDDDLTAAGGAGAALLASPVVAVSLVRAQGLYNPYTMGGRIVVDGVLASAHSDWFLEAAAPQWALPYLPTIYQALLLPVRRLARLCPRLVAFADLAAHGRYGQGWNDMGAVQVLRLAVEAAARTGFA